MRLKSKRKAAARENLLARDGPNCWLCGEPHMLTGVDSNNPNAMTIEHLVNVSDGGDNKLGGLVLVGFRCNQELRDLSLVEKIKLRDRRNHQQ